MTMIYSHLKTCQCDLRKVAPILNIFKYWSKRSDSLQTSRRNCIAFPRCSVTLRSLRVFWDILPRIRQIKCHVLKFSKDQHDLAWSCLLVKANMPVGWGSALRLCCKRFNITPTTQLAEFKHGPNPYFQMMQRRLSSSSSSEGGKSFGATKPVPVRSCLETTCLQVRNLWAWHCTCQEFVALESTAVIPVSISFQQNPKAHMESFPITTNHYQSVPFRDARWAGREGEVSFTSCASHRCLRHAPATCKYCVASWLLAVSERCESHESLPKPTCLWDEAWAGALCTCPAGNARHDCTKPMGQELHVFRGSCTTCDMHTLPALHLPLRPEASQQEIRTPCLTPKKKKSAAEPTDSQELRSNQEVLVFQFQNNHASCSKQQLTGSSAAVEQLSAGSVDRFS